MKIYPTTLTRRFFAYVIDFLMLVVAASVLISLLNDIYDRNRTLGDVLTFVILMALLFYVPLMEGLNHGQTIGKMCTGIRVLRTDGTPVSVSHALLRYLILVIDLPLSFCSVGVVTSMVTKRRQRLGDIVADTVVVTDNYHRVKHAEAVNLYGDLDVEEATLLAETYSDDKVERYDRPLEMAHAYLNVEADMARMRTRNAHPVLLEYLESVRTTIHIKMFRHRAYSLRESVAMLLRGVPRAIYESRWCIVAALVVALVSIAAGMYSQRVSPDFANDILGPHYVHMTQQNIDDGNPMAVYASDRPLKMFFDIFFNNLVVTLRCFIFGMMLVVGPLFFLVSNFIMVGTFWEFFNQHGLLAMSLLATGQHGVLELSSIVITAGAALRLGTGWLFPGRLSRMRAWARSARQAVLILASTLPMVFVAAIIESFVTAHTEWPQAVRVSIVLVSSIIIIGYYVVLPIIAKRR